jgi:serine/threonine protein kinase
LIFFSSKVLRGNGKAGYNTKVDCWSLGVILYTMLSGSMPFSDDDQSQLYARIQKGVFSFPENLFSRVSKEARDLIARLLTVDPRRRITVHQAINHPWMHDIIIHENDKSRSNSMEDSMIDDDLHQSPDHEINLSPVDIFDIQDH